MTIKTFDAIIQTIGPIHIGSGQVLKKQDYIYDFHKSKVHMINGNQLVKVLKRKNLLNMYQEFLRYPPKNPRENGLKNFLEAHKITQSEWKEFISYSESVNQGKSMAILNLSL